MRASSSPRRRRGPAMPATSMTASPSSACRCSSSARATSNPFGTRSCRRRSSSAISPHVARSRGGVDPVLGRLAFPEGQDPDAVEVAFSYGFPGDLGGGPYDRRESLAAALPDPDAPSFQIGVGRERDDPAPVAGDVVETLTAAVDAWNGQPPGTVGAIAIIDSRSYEEQLTGTHALRIPAGSRLVIVAADWPVDEDEDGQPVRRRGRLVADGRRPHLRGTIEVVGTPGDDPDDPGGVLAVDGLLVEGDVRVLAGDLGALRLAHCTIAPPGGSLAVAAEESPGKDNRRLDAELERSVCGGVAVSKLGHGLRVAESIVDGAIGGEPDSAAPDAEIARSTVLGATTVRSIEASESIFFGTVIAERRQRGCVRYCYLPFDSLAPRRFRCRPVDEAAADVVAPAFASARHGDPDYCQLARQCPREIARGGENEGELGAWSFLEQPRRVDNLTTRLDEYLRFGLQAGVFFVT